MQCMSLHDINQNCRVHLLDQSVYAITPNTHKRTTDEREESEEGERGENMVEDGVTNTKTPLHPTGSELGAKQPLSESASSGTSSMSSEFENANPALEQQTEYPVLNRAKPSDSEKTESGKHQQEPAVTEADTIDSSHLSHPALPNTSESAPSESLDSPKPLHSESALSTQQNDVITQCRITLAEFLSRQHLPPDFAGKFSAFCRLRSLGYFMMPGLRFGGVFVAYPGDPLQFHSHLIVKVPQGEVNLLELITSGRLATAVKKAWVVMEPERRGERETTKTIKDINSQLPVRAYSIEWAGFG